MPNINTKKYIESFLKIKTKEGEILPLKFNAPQQRLYDLIKKQAEQNKPIRIIILKARQMGFSTLTEAIIFKKTATAFNVNSGIVTHKEEATTNLFNMSKIYYEELPNELKPQIRASNAKEIIFDDEMGKGLRSKIRCMTAGGDGIGRSDTFHNLHISELAFWKGDAKATLTGLFPTVPTAKNTMIIIESTANGYEYFKEMWDKANAGKNDFEPLFVAWYELPEYRLKFAGNLERTEEEQKLAVQFALDDEQLNWRRWAIDNICGGDINKFKQEYPSTPAEAFLSTGDCFFNIVAVNERINEINNIPPIRCGYFSYRKFVNQYGDVALDGKQWTEDSDGAIKIFIAPKENRRYSLGVDPSGEGSDNNVCCVIDCETCEQVAELAKEKMNEDELCEQVACLANFYNNGLIAFETNFNAYLVQLLDKINGTRQFIRENAPDAKKVHKTDRYGFKTTSASRPVILSAFRVLFNENAKAIMSLALLHEMLTFVLNDAGRRYEAMIGKHDDRIFAFAIALECRGQAMRQH